PQAPFSLHRLDRNEERTQHDLRPIACAQAATEHLMTALPLSRRLRTLTRTVLMLETELRHGHLDEELLADIDQQMEHGIGSDPRCAGLRELVDALRESTITPRA